MSDVFERLAAPFPPEVISWRCGSTNGDKTKGMALAYIDSRDVMRRLDEVVGVAHWQDRYEFHGSRTVCYLSLRIDGEWITKADGAGDSDVEAEKGAISDALKRAAVKFSVGRYLYDLDSPWVAIEQRGKSSFIKKEELPRLQALLRGEKPKSAYQARKDGDFPKIEASLREAAAKGGLEGLVDAWRTHYPTIQSWSPGWIEAITNEKDRLKSELTQKEAAE